MNTEIPGQDVCPKSVLLLRSPQTTPMLLPEMCPEWLHLTIGERVPTLFPFVLPILAEYLDGNTILNCRLVNKEAKRTVDEFMREGFGRWGQHLQIATKMTSMIEDIRVLSYFFDDATSIQNFMRIMEGSQKDCNPFLTGSINIFLWHCPNHQQQEVLGPFLAVYGMHVLSLIFYDRSYNSFGSEKRLTSLESLLWILEHLPNLRSLKVHGSDQYRIEKEGIAIYDAPRLQKLNELCLIPGFKEDNSEPIFLLLGSWRWTVKAVSLEGWFLRSEDTTVDGLFHSVPLLKRLEVHEICTIGLRKLSEILWRLEELQIRDTMFHPANPTAIKLLLKTLISFRATLVRLKIFFGETPLLKYTMGEDELNLLESEMTPMGDLKELTVNLACLKLSWFWKFMERSCGYLKELFLYQEEILQEKVDMVQSSKRLFTVISSLKKITVFSTRGKKETLFRRD